MAYPNLKQSVWLVVLSYLIIAGSSLLLYLLGTILDQDLLSILYVDRFVSLVSLVLVIVYAQQRTDRTWPDILLFRTVPWGLYLPLAVSIVGLSIAISIVESAVHYLIPMPEPIVKIFREMVWKETPYTFAFYSLAVQAPLTEEVLFRGIILIGLLAHQTRKRAIFWSAFLFAVFHMNPWQFPGPLIVGIVFARWVIQTGSLIPVIAGHALHNFLFLMVARYEILGPMDDFNHLVFLPWWLNVCGIVLAVVGLWWFNQIAKRGGTPLDPPADLEPVETAAAEKSV